MGPEEDLSNLKKHGVSFIEREPPALRRRISKVAQQVAKVIAIWLSPGLVPSAARGPRARHELTPGPGLAANHRA